MNNLIPRKILFGNPDKVSPKISFDGQYIAYLAPLNGVLNLYVAHIDNMDEASCVTHDIGRGIRSYLWSYDGHLLYMQDNNGDENWHLYRVNLEDLSVTNLTDFPDTRVHISNLSHKFPNHALIQMNRRRKDYFDLYKLNLSDGGIDEIFQNDEFSELIADDEFVLRFAKKLLNNSEIIVYKINDDRSLEEFMHIGSDDIYTTSIIDFDADDNLYMIDSIDRNTAALVRFDLNNCKKTVLYENDKTDVESIILHPTEKYLQALTYNYLRKETEIFDKNFEESFNYIRNNISGEVHIISRTLDDKIWIVAGVQDDGPVAYYKYDRSAKNLNFLFHNKSDLLHYNLTKMHPVIIKARDGLEMVSYLTLPSSIDFDIEKLESSGASPLILWVHGGPTARDNWGYDPIHQWLANRGYAVLSVNYRGSTGFGKDFVNAGNGEWSRKMHTDLLDAVQWAINSGITAKDQVAIGGGSYGGYAALVGLTFTPDVFKCAIDIVGPSNLKTLLETIPPYWKPHIAALEKKIGGSLDTEDGIYELQQRSPINFVDRISKPLLIGHGANDPRVKQSESDQIVDVMKRKNIPVTYILYPEEGHGFAKPENRMSFYAIAESFLHLHMLGAYEDVGNDFQGANFQNISTKSKT